MEEHEEEKVPEIVKEEPDDKKAAFTIHWAIWVAVAVLILIYLIFIYR